jgi:RNA recognition motif-containing protein
MEPPAKLLLSNVPAKCDPEFLHKWVEARGYRTFGVRLIRDSVTGTSPSFAYVQLFDSSKLDEAARALDGQKLCGFTIRVERIDPNRRRSTVSVDILRIAV